MKLTAIIVLSACLTASANGFSQKVTLSEKNARLENVFEIIKKQTGYKFLYTIEQLQKAMPITIELKDVELLEALRIIFSNQPLTYAIIEKNIVIKPKAENIESDELPPPIDIKGRVVNENGDPVVATVMVKGTVNAVTTDANGAFEIKGVDENATLLITGVSIETKEIKVGGKTVVEIEIKTKISKLDEIKIIGYGTTTQRYSTGNVSKISSSEISRMPISNPLQAIQGRAPGVIITTANGLPGAEVKIQIRGQSSITAGNDPLYVIDGVPFISQSLNDDAKLRTATGNLSPFNTLNPASIASIEVLKDADATSIYGSRGSNGVILITTKKGIAGKIKADVNVYHGVGKVARYREMMNTQQYLAMRREAFRLDNVTPTIGNAPDLLLWDTTQNINWDKYLANEPAKVTDAQAAISGGNSFVNFRIGGFYRKEGTPYIGNFENNKAGFNLSMQFSSSNKRFSGNIVVNYSSDHNNAPSYSNPAGNYFKLPPNYPLYNPDGSLYWFSAAIDNPLAFLIQKGKNNTLNFIANSSFKYLILPQLSIKGSVGINTVNLEQTLTYPKNSVNPFVSSGLNNPPYPNSSRFAENGSKTYIAETQVEYLKTFGGSKIQFLAGTTLQHSLRESFYILATGYTNASLLENLSSAGSILAFSNTFSEYKYASLFGRVSYQYLNKYVFNVNFRRDASSRFGPNNQTGNFGAAGAGWIFTNENWLKKLYPVLSYGKFRISYGLTGNDQIGDYQYLQTYTTSSTVTYGGQSVLVPARIANPEFSWETNKKFETGIELGFFNDKLLFYTSWYLNRSSNQLTQYPLPIQTGFTGYQINLPALVENKGLEFELTYNKIASKKLGWTSSINLSLPKNKLVEFPGLVSSSYATTYVIGYPLNVSRGYNFLGVNPLTGAADYEDVNQDNVINSTGDQIILGDPNPIFTGGFSNSFTYKGLELNILFIFEKRNGYTGFANTTVPGSDLGNVRVNLLQRWHQPGDITIIPGPAVSSSSVRYSSYISKYALSSVNFGDMSFARLKNINLSYSLPDNIIKRLGLGMLKFYVQGVNILTFTKYKGLDIESQTTTSGIPSLRTVITGVQLTL